MKQEDLKVSPPAWDHTGHTCRPDSSPPAVLESISNQTIELDEEVTSPTLTCTLSVNGKQ